MSIRARRAPHTPVLTEESSTTTSPTTTQPSNSAMLDVMEAEQGPGPIDRLYDRILQNEEDSGFSMDTLRAYLDEDLQLCEGEWFRGTKLNKSSEALVNQLDTDKSADVSREEFGGFRGQVLGAIAPGLEENASDEEVTLAALSTFSQIDGEDGDGALSLKEIQKTAKEMLPKGTENADIVAQLGARVAMDAADTDQREEKVADRTLTQDEWVTAALQMQARRRAPPSND